MIQYKLFEKTVNMLPRNRSSYSILSMDLAAHYAMKTHDNLGTIYEGSYRVDSRPDI